MGRGEDGGRRRYQGEGERKGEGEGLGTQQDGESCIVSEFFFKLGCLVVPSIKVQLCLFVLFGFYPQRPIICYLFYIYWNLFCFCSQGPNICSFYPQGPKRVIVLFIGIFNRTASASTLKVQICSLVFFL